MNTPTSTVQPFVCGIALLLMPTLCFALASLQIACGSYVSWIPAAVSLVCGLFYAYYAAGLRTALLTLLIVLACGTLCLFTFDSAFDSLSYHKPGAAALTGTWNPVTDFFNGVTRNRSVPYWINYYARFEETSAASIAMLTHSFELGRITAMLVPTSTAFLVYGAILPSCGKRWAIITTAALMLNPVIAGQIFTYLNDHYLYCGFLNFCVIALMLQDNRLQSVANLLLAATILMMVNTKFTHFFFACIFWILLVGYLWCRARRNIAYKELWIGAVGIITSAIIFGFAPYVVNLLNFGDPFYPLACGECDIMTANTPEIYLEHNRLWCAIHSLFGGISHPLMIFPTGSNSRMWAYGPWFLPMLIGSAIILWETRVSTKVWFCWLAVIFSLLIFRQGWWARYVPMPWAAVGFALFVANRSNKTTKVVACAVASMAIVTGGLHLCGNAWLAVKKQLWFIELSQQPSPVSITCHPNTANGIALHLSEMNIPYRMCDSIPCGDAVPMPMSPLSNQSQTASQSVATFTCTNTH